MPNNFDWPAPIKRVQHATAKRLRLTVHTDYIRLTVPKNCPDILVTQFLSQSHAWVLKVWQSQVTDLQSLHVQLPKKIHLFNLDQAISVKTSEISKLYNYYPQSMILIVNHCMPFKGLKSFLLDYAKEHLPMYLQQVSLHTQLNYSAVQVRYVNTRWGSCNAQHKIMLSATLVLLAEPLVRTICIHELSHTQVFNHSALFWKTVEKHDEHYKMHHQQLRKNRWPNWVVEMLKRA